MSFLSDIFGKKKEVEQPVPNRQDMEGTLKVAFENVLTAGYVSRTVRNVRDPQEVEKEQLKQVFDVISSVPAGKDLIDRVAAAGFKFTFNAYGGDADGSMSGGNKRIMLCPCQHSSIAGMAATAFHEMVHAVQDTDSNQLLSDSSSLNIADQFKFNRACEAAAWTEEARFAYQIKDKYPEVLSHVAQFPMYQVFDKEMSESGDLDKASEKAFKEWYNYPHYQQSYEKDHIYAIKYGLKGREQNFTQSDSLRGQISNQDVLDKIFITPGLNKKIDADYLTSPEALSLSPAGFESIKMIEKNFRSHFLFSKEDKSYMKMYSTENKKTFDNIENDPSAMICAGSRSAPKTTRDSKKSVAMQQALQNKLNNR
ncbi:MAG: NAD(P)H-dependent oxidoreductase [Alphaproteobacteria bacterium]|nr:NAD(P)H-dependent oxidoreductase [Alphaproteobacteria bacterium]